MVIKINHGFVKIVCASLKLKVAQPSYNQKEIKSAISAVCRNGAKILLTPELSVTGYTCGDLFFSAALQRSAEKALSNIVDYSIGKDLVIVVGMPVPFRSKLFNCAVVILSGHIIGVVPKINIANYGEFYEKRWFASGAGISESISLCGQTVPMGSLIFDISDKVKMGVEICEDLWTAVPPSSHLALAGANLIVNLSASDEYVSKADYRKNLVLNQSARCICAYAYAGASSYESTMDLVFSGATLIAENGMLLAEGERFSRNNIFSYADVDFDKIAAERYKNMSFFSQESKNITTLECRLRIPENCMKHRYVDPYPFVPDDRADREKRCREIFSIQAAGLAGRLEHVGSQGCVLGISGGLDSTLALLVCTQAMKLIGKSNSDIIGITMPGFGTTDKTYRNAIALMDSLGVTAREISIADACIQHMKDIGHDPAVKDITYENAQARERTQILFDMANKQNALLVGTGDLSELALGWCTYNGDHMSMYGVNASVPKTLVRYLVEYVASISSKETAAILNDILETPVSPELLPPDTEGNIAQKTEEDIGPYELHDFFLYHFIRFGCGKEKLALLAKTAFRGKYEEEDISKWLAVFLKRFFSSQFKRSCVPDSPKVGSVSLSPRGDWRMPSDASAKDFQ